MLSYLSLYGVTVCFFKFDLVDKANTSKLIAVAAQLFRDLSTSILPGRAVAFRLLFTKKTITKDQSSAIEQ